MICWRKPNLYSKKGPAPGDLIARSREPGAPRTQIKLSSGAW